MTNLSDYLQDGANYQARAVLAFLQINNVEESWNAESKQYDAKIYVARWENCREQGYVVMLRSKDYKRQLNIAFFEHRNSDNVHAVKWEEVTLNPPTIDTANFGDIYIHGYDTSYRVSYGEALAMSKWIFSELVTFWRESSL